MNLENALYSALKTTADFPLSDNQIKRINKLIQIDDIKKIGDKQVKEIVVDFFKTVAKLH